MTHLIAGTSFNENTGNGILSGGLETVACRAYRGTHGA